MTTDERRKRYLKFRSPTGPSRSRIASGIVSREEQSVSINHLDVLEEDGLTETQSLRTSRLCFRHPRTEHFACIRFLDKIAKEDQAHKSTLIESDSRTFASSPKSRIKLPHPRKQKLAKVISMFPCCHKKTPVGSVKPLCSCQRSFGNLARDQILKRKHMRAEMLAEQDMRRGKLLRKNALRSALKVKTKRELLSSTDQSKPEEGQEKRPLALSAETIRRLGADDIIVGKIPRAYPSDALHDFAEVRPLPCLRS